MGPAISFKARLTVCTEQSLLFIGYHMVNMDLIRVAKKKSRSRVTHGTKEGFIIVGGF